MPQQFGVWQVAGLGIVVAFRGTASQEDVIIDANISPVPLDAARVTRGESWTACGVSAQCGILEGNSVKAGSGWDGASFLVQNCSRLRTAVAPLTERYFQTP